MFRTLALTHRHPHLARIFIVLFAGLMVFACMPTHARAAEDLTDSQMQSVLNVLSSFGAGESMVANVQNALRGADIFKKSNQAERDYTASPVRTYPTPTSTASWSGYERIDATIQPSTATGPNDARMSSSTSLYKGEGGTGIGRLDTMKTPKACPVLINALKRGSSGNEVAQLQSFLAQYKDLYPSGQVTGYFGPSTEAAVKLLQVRLGVIASGNASASGHGTVGPRTRELVKGLCAGVIKNTLQNATSTYQGQSTYIKPKNDVPNGQGKQPEGVMCTRDAKLCPNGAVVGRSGPNCQFVCEPGQ